LKSYRKQVGTELNACIRSATAEQSQPCCSMGVNLLKFFLPQTDYHAKFGD